MYFLNGSTPPVAARGLFDWLRVLHVLVLLCCLQGCQTYTLNVAYQSTGIARIPGGSDNTPVTLFLPPVEDQRSQGIRSLNVCFVGSAHTYKTDRPPTDIVREALATELSLLGVRVSSTATDAQASFKGVLRRFEQCLTEDTSTVEIQAEVHAQEGSRLLWGGTLQNQVVKTSGTAYSPTFAADLSSGLSQALSAAVQQLGQNSNFAQAVTNLRGRSPVRPSPNLAFPPSRIY